MGTRLIVPQCDVQVMPIVEEVVREAYRAEGKLEQFRREDIRFLSPSQFAFASGYMGIVHRERAASCFLFGAFAAESLILGEAGQQVGAMQVAGTVSNAQLPFFITTCDYTLIGEEVYAAGAYLSEEASQLGGLRGQDVAKMFALGTISLGLLFALFLALFRGDSEEGRMYASPFTQALYAKPMSRRCLARLDINVPFAPSAAPSWDSLNPDLDEASCDACEAAGKLARRLRALDRELQGQAAWLKESAALVQGEYARRAVQEVAARSEGAAARAAKEAEAVSLAAEGELRAEERYRKIAGELFLARARPRIERIAGWSNAGSGWSDERVGEALARAVSALEKLAASPTDDGAHLEAREAVRDAYELACDRYYDLARDSRRELESKAASDEYPAGESPVVMNATKSVDADGDELVYSFAYRDGEKAEESPAPVARHAYKAAGTYAVKLTVSDGLPKQTFNVAPPPAKDSAVLRLETAAGTELELNWPLPTNAVEGSAKLKWDFGGKDVRTEQSAKHVYTKPGHYTLQVEREAHLRQARTLHAPGRGQVRYRGGGARGDGGRTARRGGGGAGPGQCPQAAREAPEGGRGPREQGGGKGGRAAQGPWEDQGVFPQGGGRRPRGKGHPRKAHQAHRRYQGMGRRRRTGRGAPPRAHRAVRRGPGGGRGSGGGRAREEGPEDAQTGREGLLDGRAGARARDREEREDHGCRARHPAAMDVRAEGGREEGRRGRR
jgi:hypothetical protein